MKLGPIEIKWRKKSWSQLESMIQREKGSVVETLKVSPKQQLESYKSWVYSCVSIIKDRVSVLPYSFYNKDTGEELSTKNKGYRTFTKPFRKPNDLMSFRFIKSFCQIQLDLCGMTCIYKARNRLQQVWELWPLNMNDFIGIYDSKDLPIQLNSNFMPKDIFFVFVMGGSTYKFSIHELIIVNYPHPSNIFLGMSPIQAQAYAADIDTYVEVYERDFFKNSARIDFALTTDEQIDQEKADELKQRWIEKFRGRFHDVAVLDSGLKPIPLKYTNRDFEFLHLAGWSKEKILGCYRVPASKLGSTDSNRAGAVYSDISFNREAVQPRLTLWDEELTIEVCSSFDDRLEIRHQNPIPRDRQIELQENKSYLAGIPSLTINEFREKIHKLPKIDGGDRIIIPNKFIYLDDLEKVTEAMNQQNPANSDRDRDDEEPHTNPDGSDDRDDNPTDGRNLLPEEIKEKASFKDFFTLVQKSRTVWNEMIYQALKDVNPKNIEKYLNLILVECLSATVDVYFAYYDSEKNFIVDANDWIIEIASKTSHEYIKTLFKNPKWEEEEWKDYFKDQFDSNPRLSKIINALLKSCINYTKWLILTSKGMEIEWVVNSNECGHKGRIKETNTFDFFKIGITKIRFPGEVLSFNCDCTIINKE